MNQQARRKRLFWLGVILIALGLVALLPLYFIELPGNNVQVLSMGVGVVLGWGSMAVSFYFGQSETPESTQ
ncbi:MAG: hypothetical protein IH597_14900 [Bacteroidales bacterium]|nr:hypothetical protein [Bacteroidales bacterium]